MQEEVVGTALLSIRNPIYPTTVPAPQDTGNWVTISGSTVSATPSMSEGDTTTFMRPESKDEGDSVLEKGVLDVVRSEIRPYPAEVFIDRMLGFEKEYGIPSYKFFDLYKRGVMATSREFNEWAEIFRTYAYAGPAAHVEVDRDGRATTDRPHN